MSRLRLGLLTAAAFGVALVGGPEPRRARGAPTPTAVWASGSNLYGQLGRVTPNHHVPAELGRLGGIVDVSAGSFHTLALLDDGTVWAWGRNEDGQLGDGSTTISLTPVRVAGLGGITAISAGGSHSLAFRESDGKVWAWGSNSSRQLGLPSTTTFSATPVEVGGLAAIASVVACGQHNLALDSSGAAWGWGANAFGQLGDGTTAETETPVAVQLSGVEAIGCGFAHSMAVAQGGSVFTWGLNSFGQLGQGRQDGPVDPNPVPAIVPGPTDVVDVDGGNLHCLARTATGDLWTWGYNTEGQVGNGEVTPANTGVLSAVKLSLTSVVDIAAGGIHSAAVDSTGTVWAWGSNDLGALGTNRTGVSLVPAAVLTSTSVTALTAGGAHTLVVREPAASSSALASGLNAAGQLGDGSTASSAMAVPVSMSSPVGALAAGRAHSVAILADGSLRAWGGNSRGQLGVIGGDSATPVEVLVPLAGDQAIAAVAAGDLHSLALRSDGTVWTWGDNASGQLGDGTFDSSPVPRQVPGLPEIVAIAAGGAHSLAVSPLGDVWAWGDNRCGQVGQALGNTTVASPTRIGDVFQATRVAAGACHSLARRANGTVLAWGSNDRSELGDNTRVGGPSARRVFELTGVTAIAAGAFHSLAVAAGDVWTWGQPTESQLGNGSGFRYRRPVRAEGPGDVVAVAAGAFHSLAIDDDGAGWAWGDGYAGQLAQGSGAEQPVPVPLGPSLVTTIAAGAAHTLIAVE